MREIKFRAWNGKWMVTAAYGDWLSFDGVPYTEADASGSKNIEITKAKDYLLMQYTGLKDKNGKEIYEGDIIKLIDDVGEEILVTCEFGTVQREIYGQTLNLCSITGFYFRKDGRATFPIVNNYAGKNDLQLFAVIGNIYENPELLKNDKERISS